ncbi:hypothetical protein FNV43_RR27225 [Rhamnella rubrinervis]|uniref:DUF1985 domain-containing protein n=1 Tax=Rhamnella rubrinervis TaxID=2594499 RepID=A0A8K0DK65_9ROSA|nr:hypothetical protein FNV43_RR27225 [Rhamnella rubrinervis]
MITRQTESINEDVMEFNFNGNGAIFTRQEFGIIFGLKMENTLDVLPPPYSDRIRNTYFDHIHKIKNIDVRNVFVNVRRSQLDYEDGFVRLALIYFLECGLLGKESHIRISLDYLSMVEDLNYFNQYSWGLVSYNTTLISLHKALDLHHGELNKSSTYNLGGFPLAFRFEDIKIDGVANDLGNFLLNSMRKIDGVTNDLDNFRLDSMREFQSIHNTMREMFDYIKHDYHPAKHATHSDDVNEDPIVHENFETCDVITTIETELNLIASLPPTYFNQKRDPLNELEMKLLTYMTSDDDNIDNISLVNCPVLIIHAINDVADERDRY